MQNDAHLLELLEKMAGRKCKPEGELHLCSLVEAGLLFSFRRLYYDKLQLVCSEKLSKKLVFVMEECISATWQQRTTALAQVKGVTL